MPSRCVGLNGHALDELAARASEGVEVETGWFGQDATDALAVIKDQASFAADFPAIFKNCGGCHEKYRASLN